MCHRDTASAEIGLGPIPEMPRCDPEPGPISTRLRGSAANPSIVPNVAHRARGWLGVARGIAALLFVSLAGLGAGAGAIELTFGPEVEAGVEHATIRWQTDEVAGGRVQWGVSPGKLGKREKGPTGTNHMVVLHGLKPGTKHYFTVGTARYPLATNAFTTQAASPSGPATGASSGGTTTPPSGAGSGSGVGAGGSTASPVAQPQAPPAVVTWGSIRTLRDHFVRHGRDFAAKDAEDYARQAWLFLQRGRAQGLPAKRDSEGVLRVYDPATRAFGAYNRDGTTRTYFKPSRRDYFQDQPGRPVNLKEER